MQFYCFKKLRIFLMLLSIAFLDPKMLGFLFTMKDSLTWGQKCEKLHFRIYFISFKKWESHLDIFRQTDLHTFNSLKELVNDLFFFLWLSFYYLFYLC